MAFAFSDISLIQAAAVAATALGASVVGGLAGYGTGLLLPLVLVPVIGAQATVPVIAVSALFTNASRALAFRQLIDWRKAYVMLPLALLLTMLAAFLFTRLDGRGAAIVIGSVLVVLVPLRRILMRAGYRLRAPGLAVAGGVYGFITGTSTGAGVILVSFLMASGLTGAAVVATDAAISIVIGMAKVATFRAFGALPAPLLVFALLVGLATVPGAFIAKIIAQHMSSRVHATLLDATVILGGLVMIGRALAG